MFVKISRYLLKKICEIEPEMTDQKKEELEYGIHLFIAEVSKIIVLLLSAAILGIFTYIVSICVVFWILRLHLGGIHAKSHLMCLISSFGILYFVYGLSTTSPIQPIYSLFFAAPFTLYIAYRYAPADLPEKPIVSIKKRKRLRNYGMISLVFFHAISAIAPHVLGNMIIYSCIIQSLLMTPMVYKITKNKYGYERGCEGV